MERGLPGVLWANHQFFFEADGADATTVVSHETWSGLLAPFVRRIVQPKAERVGGQQLEALARSFTRLTARPSNRSAARVGPDGAPSQTIACSASSKGKPVTPRSRAKRHAVAIAG